MRIKALFLRLAVAAFAVLQLSAGAQATVAAPPATWLLSVSSSGHQANSYEYDRATISADGRFVVFDSYATNLVPGDTNNQLDVFVRDRQTRLTTLVSVATNGTQGNGMSYYPIISADDRYVLFISYASNLVPGDTNGVADVFVRDLQNRTTTRVSVSTGGGQGNGDSGPGGISADGRYVGFGSWSSNLVRGDTNNTFDAFVRDMKTGTTSRVSLSSSGVQANGASAVVGVSSDGRYITMESDATNLVPGDTNGVSDVFVKDRLTGATTRVDVSSKGHQANAASFRPVVSSDGRYIAFTSDATNLVPGGTQTRDIYIRDRLLGTTRRVVHNSDDPAISGNGRFVAFDSNDSTLAPGTNGQIDVFVWDGATNRIDLVSRSSADVPGNGISLLPAVDGTGRYIAFESEATNLVLTYVTSTEQVFLRDQGLPLP